MDTINKQKYEDEIEIDLGELITALWEKAWIIILTAVVLAGFAFLVTKFFITPKFKSTTSIYVLARQNESTLTTSDLSASTQLTQDYAQLIKSRTVAENVIKNLGLDISPESLLSKISVDTKTNTRIISISVLDENPEDAMKIANAVRISAANQIQSVTNSEAVNVVDVANLPTKKASPSTTKNCAIAGMAGAVLSSGLILLLHFTNDTIKTSEDVERYLGLSTLGTIPLYNTNEAAVKKTKKKKLPLKLKGSK